MPTTTRVAALAALFASLLSLRAEAAEVSVLRVDADAGIEVVANDERIVAEWPDESGTRWRLALDLRPDRPLVEALGRADRPDRPVLRGADPVTFVTVGTRAEPGGRPPAMSPFNVFFDSPASRPHETFAATLQRERVRVLVKGRRAAFRIGPLTAGPFAGDIEISIGAGSGLVQVEAVVSTDRPRTAFTYDAGLVLAEPGERHAGWFDPEGKLHREPVEPEAENRAIAVRHRMLAIESPEGSLACLPPPHQFFYPRDLTDNQRTVWLGRNHRGLEARTGFGVAQTETGGGNFVPWFNAPPGTEQRLGVFYLPHDGDAENALRDALRYTRGDRFADLPGYVTFTSHWHMAITMAALDEIARGGTRTVPDLVRMFKDMNVRIVHLAEFHGDGHPQDPGPVRLKELAAMFDECRRLSDGGLLFLPGEEANVHLGNDRPGQSPGHWLYLFPRPVWWIMNRGADAPFIEDDPERGKVYHVGDRDEMLRLLEIEHGLAWTAHPRIKASSWTPDAYKDEDFFRSDVWLGAAWKAMPADLSLDHLGRRVLDLFDDMANWGARKYVLGEVDVFKIDHTHELYGHMNVNYLKLDRMPRFDEDWSPVLDCLRRGRFFVTTGEVLIESFTVGGKASGETLGLADDSSPEIRAELSWTFPPRFVEVVSGDGESVYRERVELDDAPAFGRRTITLAPELKGRRWVRLEAWDIATDGAFTEPVWLEP